MKTLSDSSITAFNFFSLLAVCLKVIIAMCNMTDLLSVSKMVEAVFLILFKP